jgi:uncharacterized membrane protein YjgN (DUF898 family)
LSAAKRESRSSSSIESPGVVNDILAPPIVPARAAPVPVCFFNERRRFRRMVGRGALLEFVTVGFYRFWLANDMRRHLWSHTAVGGDTLEYTGTARELLIGFLFAVAILAPIYLIYFLLGLEAERYKAFASVPMGLFFYLFAQFAVYRARRYRLTRTVWRGVRFWMTGSGWNYAWRVGLWALLLVLTLGLTLPWRQAVLERFKMRHTSYGNVHGRFVGSGTQLFRRGWGLWAIMMAPIVLAIVLGVTKHEVLATIMGFVPVIAAPFVYPIYKAIEWRWWVEGIQFGEVRFESSMRRTGLLGLYWKVIGWLMVIFSVLSTWVGGAMGIAVALLGFRHTTAQDMAVLMQSAYILAPIAVGYVMAVLAMWAVTRIYLIHDVWQKVAQSTTVYNLGTAEDVVAEGKPVTALGEGFADSLDVVGF